MSRVYRALEKAEKEKQERLNEPPSITLGIEERAELKPKETPIRFPEKKRVELTLPAEEKTPVLVAPTRSFAGEQFRKLKTQIFHQSPIHPHLILITSTTPQEGKTLVAMNLALAIAQEINKKVILIDGDLRNPSIQIGKSRPSKGLSNYLSDQTPLSEILLNSEIDNLRFIPGGSSTIKSTELIGSDKMKNLLTLLRQSGEETYIIIDSPPIISTADPVLYSKLVEGVLFVVRAGRTSREMIRRAILSIDKEKLIGIVLNSVDVKQSGYYSEYQHYYSYYHKGKKD
jgi:protein-tyrosine kinase